MNLSSNYVCKCTAIHVKTLLFRVERARLSEKNCESERRRISQESTCRSCHPAGSTTPPAEVFERASNMVDRPQSAAVAKKMSVTTVFAFALFPPNKISVRKIDMKVNSR